MPWKSVVKSDTDDVQQSTSTATWTDPDPSLGVFTYSRRVNRRSLTDEDDFVSEANTAKDAWAIEKARLNVAQSDLDVKLNT